MFGNLVYDAAGFVMAGNGNLVVDPKLGGSPTRNVHIQPTSPLRNAGDNTAVPSIVPPWGYYQPVRGFGKAWRQEPGVRDRLGWATDTERGFSAAVQSFEHGLMIWSNAKGIYVLYHDGTWQRFD